MLRVHFASCFFCLCSAYASAYDDVLSTNCTNLPILALCDPVRRGMLYVEHRVVKDREIDQSEAHCKA